MARPVLSAVARLLLVLLPVLGIGAGCGYRFLARDARLPRGFSTIEVPLARNGTREVGLEAEASAAASDALRSRTAIAVVPGGGAAILRISLLTAEGRPRAVGSGTPRALRAVVEAEFSLEEPSGTVLWRSGALRGEADYAVAPFAVGEDFLLAEALRRRAMESIVRELAGRAIDLLVSVY